MIGLILISRNFTPVAISLKNSKIGYNIHNIKFYDGTGTKNFLHVRTITYLWQSNFQCHIFL